MKAALQLAAENKKEDVCLLLIKHIQPTPSSLSYEGLFVAEK
jgi:hypothetical protein